MGAISVVGDLHLKWAMASLGKNAPKRIMKPAVNAALTPVNKAAKRNVSRKSGDLRRAIGKRVKARRDSVTGKITIRAGHGGAAKYAHMLEFGTDKMPARPFMRTAMYQQKRAAMTILRKKAWENVKKQAAKLRRRG